MGRLLCLTMASDLRPFQITSWVSCNPINPGYAVITFCSGPFSLHPMRYSTLCHPTLCVTPPYVSLHPMRHSTLCVTPPYVSLHPMCHSILCVTPPCVTPSYASLHPVSLHPMCHSTLCVTPPYVSLHPMCHSTLCHSTL